LTFPDYQNLPAGLSQLFNIALVAQDTSLPFILPEFFMCGGFDLAISTSMNMPETTMNKDYLCFFHFPGKCLQIGTYETKMINQKGNRKCCMRNFVKNETDKEKTNQLLYSLRS
jgi:hypothetical protein